MAWIIGIIVFFAVWAGAVFITAIGISKGGGLDG